MTYKWKSRSDLREVVTNAAKHHASMRAAAASLGMKYHTFVKYAKLYDVFQPNQSGRGIPKPNGNRSTVSLDSILRGDHPLYPATKLKHRLFKEGIKQNRCERCDLTEWQGKPITCEIDHINENHYDHRLENLQILCPNCHSQKTEKCHRGVKAAAHA